MAHRYTLTPEESPSEGIYSAVATVEGCSPLNLPPLAEATNPDALDEALAGGVPEVSFEYYGYEIIASDEEILVHESGEG